MEHKRRTLAGKKADPVDLKRRIEWILETRKLAQRSLSRAAGLSDGYVSALLTRLRQDPTGTMDAPAAQAIAAATRVSLRWLLTGEGEPEESEDRYRPLAERKGWATELARARAARPPGLPERYLEEAGALVVPSRELTSHLILGIAETLARTESGTRSDNRR